jgi:predicted membrane-bound mannosyltransferase
LRPSIAAVLSSGAAPILVAAALALVGIGHWPLWQDEAFTWNLVQLTFGEIVDGAAGDRHPPLYYLIVAPLRVFGDRDELVRLPSALAFIAAVAISAHAARRHFGANVATSSGGRSRSPPSRSSTRTTRVCTPSSCCGARCSSRAASTS